MNAEHRATLLSRNARYLWLGSLFLPPLTALLAYDLIASRGNLARSALQPSLFAHFWRLADRSVWLCYLLRHLSFLPPVDQSMARAFEKAVEA